MSGAERARVFVSASGNLFMTEIAELVAAGLRDLGVEVELRRTGLPAPAPGLVNLVVAPHEYFPLLGPDHNEAAFASLRHCALLLTEQPDSPWFDLGLAYAARAAAVVDINPAGVDRLRSLGLDAHLLRLGYHRNWDHWKGRDGDRPLDVVFMGGLTPRREAQLSALGSTLSRFESRLLFHDPRRPQTEAAANYLHGVDKFRLLRSAKVLLNMHRDETPYFEWHRMLGAMVNGCVVLTENVVDPAPLEPFRHFAMCDLDLMADYVRLLLADHDLLDALRHEAYTALRGEHDLVDGLAAVWPALQTDGEPREVPPAAAAALARAFAAPAAPQAVAAVPSPAVGTLLKRQVIAEIRLRRRVDALECRLEHGSPQRVTVTTTPGYGEVRPDVSVVVPLHNYEGTVVEALDSVFRSLEVVPEAVVVDDHSTDGSREAVRRYMGRHPERPVKLVALAANVGLPAARNLGFAEARADDVFLLDADNWVYPAALRKLLDALWSSDASFAYSMIEGFGTRRRLLSIYPWDVGRLLECPYIDAMTLVRKAAWEKVGGFTDDLRIYGWEDYAFWLSLADAGLDGVLVPEILCGYRLHEDSMINVTNLDPRETVATLRSMYASLPWSTAGA